jgi:hypothetical protein
MQTQWVYGIGTQDNVLELMAWKVAKTAHQAPVVDFVAVKAANFNKLSTLKFFLEFMPEDSTPTSHRSAQGRRAARVF